MTETVTKVQDCLSYSYILSSLLIQVAEELKKLNHEANILVLCGGLIAPQKYMLVTCGVIPSQHQYQAFYEDDIATASPHINSIIAHAAFPLMETIIIQQNLNDPKEFEAGKS